MKTRPDRYIYITLVLAIFGIYAQVAGFDFVNYDDPGYLTDNPHIRDGLSPAGLRWAFTATEPGYWFPMTRLSELLEYQVFGLRPGPQHIVNVALHALAACFLFAFLRRATGHVWRSAMVAAIFALHPLHVESVAWLTERKDVLSALFFFLALDAYVKYARLLSRGQYFLTLAWFCLGLMSKPMVVTLPAILVLLDFWPLARWTSRTPQWREKLPFVALAAAISVATFIAQKSEGAVAALSLAPLGMRVGNALVSYVVYIWMMLWPANLAAFYPFNLHQPAWQPVLAALALVGISVLAVRGWKSRPYFLVGWAWYVVMLLPVIGLIQVGGQALADRFVYLPMTGLTIAVVWWVRPGKLATAVAAAALVAFAAVSWVQLQYWQDSETLFRRAIEVTADNYLSHYQLAVHLADKPGRLGDAITEYRAALRSQPNNYEAHNNLGVAYSKTPGRLADAVTEYQAALRAKPGYVLALNNLGAALADLPGRAGEAIAPYESALRLEPQNAAIHFNLAQAFGKAGQTERAIGEYRTAIRLNPGMPAPHTLLANLLVELPGRLPEAIAEYQAALRLQANDADLYRSLGYAYSRSSRWQEAVTAYENALRIRPDYAEAHNNLGFALANIDGKMPQAIEHFRAAIRIKPDYRDAESNLGLMLTKIPGQRAEAIAHLEAALRLRPDAGLQKYVNDLKTGKN